jgi:NADH:ubiquinone oxidoreductase subunit F (NADH-binding)
MSYLKFNQPGKRINVKGYLYLNTHFYRKYGQILRNIIHNDDIEIFHKPEKAGYIGGEETALLNVMEGGVAEPRLRPPFPVTNGLWDSPTLVNNVETFYDISLIMHNQYEGKRFYTLSGDILHKGVFSFPETYSIDQILIETGNHPLNHGQDRSKYDFFVQIGGDGSGDVLNSNQLNTLAKGGAITVHSLHKHEPMELLKYWVNFFFRESCGQCVPCREGAYRLNEMLKKKEIDWVMFFIILNSLKESSLCGLGGSVHVPIYSYIENVLKKYSGADLGIDDAVRKIICDSFVR